MAAESKLERDIVQYAKAAGWWSSKYVAPGLRGVPDRLFIRNGLVLFAEIKAPGEIPTPQQIKRHRDMRAAGAIVRVWDNYDDAKSDLDLF